MRDNHKHEASNDTLTERCSQSINQSITLFANSAVTRVNNERNMAGCKNRQEPDIGHLQKDKKGDR